MARAGIASAAMGSTRAAHPIRPARARGWSLEEVGHAATTRQISVGSKVGVVPRSRVVAAIVLARAVLLTIVVAGFVALVVLLRSGTIAANVT